MTKLEQAMIKRFEHIYGCMFEAENLKSKNLKDDAIKTLTDNEIAYAHLFENMYDITSKKAYKKIAKLKDLAWDNAYKEAKEHNIIKEI